MSGTRHAGLTTRWPRRGRRAGVLVLGLLAALPACSTVQVRYPDGSTVYQSRAEFARYTERVFRHSNRVLDDLITATELHGKAPDAALRRAERETQRECQPLNDSVVARRDGRKLGFFTKLALLQAVPACEAASKRLEALLPSI